MTFSISSLIAVCLASMALIFVRVLFRMWSKSGTTVTADRDVLPRHYVDSVFSLSGTLKPTLDPAHNISTSVRPIVADIYRKPVTDSRRRAWHMPAALTQALPWVAAIVAVSMVGFMVIEGGLALSANFAGQNGVTTARQDWYNQQWPARLPMTIDHTLVEEDLTDFPVLVSLQGDQFPIFNQSPKGQDLVFTAGDGVTKLAYEIEQYDAVKKILVAWVKVPKLMKATDTNLYLYYGNAQASDQSEAENVWTNGYALVYRDSQGVPGKIGNALLFKSPKDVVDLGNLKVGAKSPLTISAWINPTANAGTIVGQRDAVNTQWQFFTDPSGLLQLREDTTGRWPGHVSAGSAATRVALNKWQYVAVTVDAYGTPTFFNEGVMEAGSHTKGTFVQRAINASIGARWTVYPQTIYQFKGLIDTVRIANVVRSAGWLRTEQTNQAYPTTFLQVGTQAQTTYVAKS